MNNTSSPYRDFLHMSAEQAAIYTEHIVRVQEVRLSDLAYAVVGTDGPVDGLDGTFESLKVFWPWYVDFARADFPGLHDGLLPAREVRQHAETRPNLASELVEAYVFEVLSRIDPGAKWVAYRGTPDDNSNGETVISLTSGMWKALDSEFGATTRLLLESFRQGPAGWQEGSYLASMVWSRLLGRVDRAEAERQKTGPSILRPYLDQPPIAVSDPRRQVPELGPLTHRLPWEKGGPGLLHEELVIAKLGKDLGEYESASPLDAKTVLTALLALGVRTRDGKPPTLKSLQSDEESFVLGADDRIEILTFGHRRKLRQIGIDAYFEAERDWAPRRYALAVLAQDLGAIMSPDGDFPNVVIRP